MSGKDMFLNSVREAAGYGAHTFMLYTGAPQNTRRKPVEELNIDAGWEAMHQYGMEEFVVHAPYIINLANTVKPETFQLAVDFLTLEVQRTVAMKSQILILHPGAHVGAGVEAGTAQIIKGLNEVLAESEGCYILVTLRCQALIRCSCPKKQSVYQSGGWSGRSGVRWWQFRG